MARYILIVNSSGYVWGEADASDPVEACVTINREIGGDEYEYDVSRFGSSVDSGFHVYEAPADWTPVADGRDGAEIDRVERTCKKVAEVASRRRDEDATP